MIYGDCLLNENYTTPHVNEFVVMFDVLDQNARLCIECCLSEMDILSEVYIPPEYKNEQKKSLWTSIKELAARLWDSFKKWAVDLKKRITDAIKKAINKIRSKKSKQPDQKSNTGDDDKKTTQQQSSSEPEKKYKSLNDKFDKVDEKNLMRSEVLNLSACLSNYDKELFENYDNAKYTKEITRKTTNGLYESIDDLKADDLVGETTTQPDESMLKGLATKYDKMISEVDAYFNALQDSIRKAEAKYKDMGTTGYEDDKISAKVSNPLEYMRMKKILQASVKMIGAQSGIVRNIVYAKVSAINKVLEAA